MEYKFYRDCSDLPIYNFQKVLETNNYAYLLRDFDEYNPFELKDDFARDKWQDIYSEYCKLNNDNVSLMYYDKALHLIYLETRRFVVGNLLMILIDGDCLEENIVRYIDALYDFGYCINKENPLEEELMRMYKQFKGSNNKIELLKKELDELSEGNEENIEFEKEVIYIAQALGKNSINVRKTSTKTYCYMVQLAKETIEAKQKTLKRGR